MTGALRCGISQGDISHRDQSAAHLGGFLDRFDDRAPLSPQVFHILLALADAPAHGYAIMQDVERETNGTIRLAPGTLYGAIRRLRQDELIEETDDGADAARRCYRLTPRGRDAVVREAARLERLVSAARARRLLPGEG